MSIGKLKSTQPSILLHHSIYLFFIFFFIIFDAAYAQKYVYKHFQVADGLPQSYIYTLDQSKNGFLWVGTAEGICKYDGKTFFNFTIEDSLAESFVNASFLDQSDNLWLGHYEGGITFFNQSRFQKVVEGYKIQSRINRIVAGKKGSVLVATQSDGLVEISASLVATKVVGVSEEQIIWDICKKSEQEYLLATNEGLLIYSEVDQKSITIPLFDGVQLLDLDTINDSTFLVSSDYEGIFELGFRKGNYRVKMLHQAKSILNDKLVFAKIDDQGKLWISKSETGLSKNIISKDSIIVQEIYNKEKGLNINHFNKMLKDREGNLWLGSFGNGLYELSNQAFTFFSLDNSFKEHQVNSLGIGSDRMLLIGSNDKICFFDLDLEMLKKNNSKEPFNQTIGSSILSICVDHDGNSYYATDHKGIFKINAACTKIEKWFSFDDIVDHKIFHLSLDKIGNIWLATEIGVFKINLKTKVQEKFSMLQGLAHNVVYYCYHDSKNKIWFSTHGSGISYYSNGIIKTIPSPLLTNAIDINSIIEDKNGFIWFGTYGQGLFKCDSNGELLEVYSKKSGLGSNFCYSLIIDHKNNLLIGHKTGVSKINLSTNKLSFIENSVMLNGIEFNLNAVQRDFAGNIWFGTNQGILKYAPDKDKINIFEPVTNITSLKLFFVDPDWKKLNYSVDRFALPKNVVFSHKDNHITFNFIGVCLANPLKVKYKYFLKGFDNSWSLETDETFATYTNLPPGDYSFEVLAMNNDGIWNEVPATYSFKIAPPFWKTIWFYIAIFLLIFSILFLILYIRTKSFKKQKDVLEQDKQKLQIEINERKVTERKLKESEVLLKSTNNELNNLVWRSYHDLRGPSTTIQGLVQIALLDNLAEKKDEYLALIHSTSKKLDTILRDFFQISDINNMKPCPELVELGPMLDSILNDLSAKYKIDYYFKSNLKNFDSIFIDPISTELILRNVLDNSFCYSNDFCEIELVVKKYKRQLILLISDHGNGVPKIAKDRVFEMFYRGNVHSKGNGLGLYIAKKALEKLNGKIFLFSDEGIGTTVLIKVSLST